MLDKGVEHIKGVKKERAEKLNKMGLHTIRDVINHFPRDYEDRSKTCLIAEASDGEGVTIYATVLRKTYRVVRKNLNIVKAELFDASGKMEATYFNQPFMQRELEEGCEYAFYGKIKRKFQKTEMINPITEKDRRHTGGIMPVYPLTGGISAKVFSNTVREAVLMLDNQMGETLPPYIKEKYKLCDLLFAYQNIHFPTDEHSLSIAKKRLVFEELLFLQLGLLKIKNANEGRRGASIKGFKIAEELAECLPFSLTNAQKRVIRDIARDMRDGKQLNRLVQGDVGSGKTIVALAAILFAVRAGFQAAILAPTEILATQHYEELDHYLKQFGFNARLLTGSTKTRERRQILDGIKSGEIHVLTGTHALFEDDVIFSRLALCVIDEQHRFGVSQRDRLYAKGENPHILAMSATPIPRTLALILYTDMDISIIDEMPPNRQKVDTITVREKDRKKIDEFLERELRKQNQVYVVCPLVEESEETDDGRKSAVEYKEQLEKKFPQYRIALLHGRMKAKEKDCIMMAFRNHETDILVSTTVIEVGVNVPNATVMLIENAERFGLSQLHQLRGRVGRGEKKAYAILVSDSDSKDSIKRLRVMSDTNDGFKISEEDLKLRGPGDFFGTAQTGFLDFKIANLMSDMETLNKAAGEAREIIKRDENLELYENRLLRENVQLLFGKNGITVFN